MAVHLPGGMTREQYWAAEAAKNPRDLSNYKGDFQALLDADPNNWASIGHAGEAGAITQSDLGNKIVNSGQWYDTPADTRYTYYSPNPKQQIIMTGAIEAARTKSILAAMNAFHGLNPDGTPRQYAPQAYVEPHAGAANSYDNLYKSNDYPGNQGMNTTEGTMATNPMQVQQQALARQQRVAQMNAAGRANVLQRFANSNTKLASMGKTANMARINDVGYGGSARGALPPNISGQGGINNTALMGPNAKPTFRYGVSQNISMPRGSSPGAVGYGGTAKPTMQNFGGGQQPFQFGGQAPQGMYSQGWQSSPTGGASGGMTAQMPPQMSGGYPGATGGMTGKPNMMRFGQQPPRQFGPQGVSPYVR